MLPSNDDKKLLIQSMKKLTHFISNNNIRQKQIFESLSQNDLLKIVQNLSDDNEYLRRISGLLLTELFYNNDQIKFKSIKMLNLFPQQGRICLNQLPITIQKFPSTLKKCIQLMKSPIKEEQKDKFCWTINLDRKVLQIQFLQYKKFSSFTFLDPSRNIFGFTYINQKNKFNNSIIKTIQKISKQRTNNSIDSNKSKKDNMTSSGFYKNYLQSRNRKHQSPSSSYRQYHQKRQIIKLNTPKQNKIQNNSSYVYNNNYLPNNDINNSLIINKSTNNNQMLSNNNNQLSSNNNNQISSNPQMSSSIKYENSDRQIYQKNTTTPVKNKGYNLKLDISSLSQSMKLNSFSNVKGLGNQSERDSGLASNSYRAPQTDRRHQSPSYRMVDSGIFNKNNTITYKQPQSVKNTYILQHQKFYKKVKEILKR